MKGVTSILQLAERHDRGEGDDHDLRKTGEKAREGDVDRALVAELDD